MQAIRPSLVWQIAAVVAVVTLLGCCVLVAQQDSKQTTDAAAEGENVVYRVGNGVTRPKPVSMPNPPFTDSARRKKIQGVVMLKLIVTAEGGVRDVRVTRGLEESLDQQAMTTVSTWRFEPGTKDGKPVAVELSVDVSFNLLPKGKN